MLILEDFGLVAQVGWAHTPVNLSFIFYFLHLMPPVSVMVRFVYCLWLMRKTVRTKREYLNSTLRLGSPSYVLILHISLKLLAQFPT